MTHEEESLNCKALIRDFIEMDVKDKLALAKKLAEEGEAHE